MSQSIGCEYVGKPRGVSRVIFIECDGTVYTETVESLKNKLKD